MCLNGCASHYTKATKSMHKRVGYLGAVGNHCSQKVDSVAKDKYVHYLGELIRKNSYDKSLVDKYVKDFSPYITDCSNFYGFINSSKLEEKWTKEKEQKKRKENAQAIAHFFSELGQAASAVQYPTYNYNSYPTYPAPSVAPLNINPLGSTKIKNCYTASGIEFCK
jgi:hypothetical protein